MMKKHPFYLFISGILMKDFWTAFNRSNYRNASLPLSSIYEMWLVSYQFQSSNKIYNSLISVILWARWNLRNRFILRALI
jgi:hypothetical protein